MLRNLGLQQKEFPFLKTAKYQKYSHYSFLQTLIILKIMSLTRTEKLISIKMNHVVWHISNPHLSFPRKLF